MTFPTCPNCGHGWHGLDCVSFQGSTRCPCPGAFDDDFWNELAEREESR